MIVSGGSGILICRKRARKMRMDNSNSVGNMAMSKKCNVGKITQKQGLRGVKRNAINRVVRKNDNDFDN